MSSFFLLSCGKSERPSTASVDHPIVFTAGYQTQGGRTIANYWINDARDAFTDGVINLPTFDSYRSGMATGIVSNGTDVFVSGFESLLLGYPNQYIYTAVYWKNGIEIVLPDNIPGVNSSSSKATAIALSKNNKWSFINVMIDN